MRKHILQIFIIILLLISGCAIKPDPVCTRNNKIYCKTNGNFTGQWYDYYARGLSCIEGGCYLAALADLNEAISLIPEDRRMLKAFGMHFIDYFPHRESGMVYYLTGNYNAALNALETSIKQYPTEKAYFYLDKTRKAILECEESIISKPQIIVNPFENAEYENREIWTNAYPVTISGKAKDKQYVAQIIIAGELLFLENSAQSVDFAKELYLDHGKYKIDIKVKNLRGGEGSKTIIINTDRNGPVINIQKYIPGVSVTGYIYDESGDIRLFVNNKPVLSAKEKNVPFEIPLNAREDQVLLAAKDKLENQTELLIKTSELFHTSRLSAMNGLWNTITDSGSDFVIQGVQNNDILLDIQLDSHLVYKKSISLKGNVRSSRVIKSLSINSIPVIFHPGTQISFNHFMQMKHGANPVLIKMTDETGKEHIKTFSFTRKIPQVFQLQHRYSLKIYPLHDIDQNSSLQFFMNFFIKDFVEQKRFQIYDKPKLVFNDQIKLNPADAILKLTAFETVNGIEIVGKLTEVRTSKLIGVIPVESNHFAVIKDVYYDNKDKSVMENLGQRLAEKIHMEFPLLNSDIFQRQKEKIFARYEKKKTKMGWPLLIYYEKNPNSIAGSETELVGNAIVNQLMENGYGASFKGKIPFQTGIQYKVITR